MGLLMIDDVIDTWCMGVMAETASLPTLLLGRLCQSTFQEYYVA
jgi:hypothetical protein